MSRKTNWTGWGATALVSSLLLLDASGKLLEVAPVVKGTTELGYPAALVLTIGIIELLCIVAYLVPVTSALGAVLLTGYLGGAIATHLRIGSPLLTHVLSPIYVAVFVWGGLYLRDERLRALIPLRRQGETSAARREALAR